MNKRFKSNFAKLFIPYLLITAFFFGIILIAYVVAFKEIEQNATKIQERYIDQSKLIIDSRITEALNASNQIKQIPLVNAFRTFTEEDLKQNYLPALELYNQLRTVRFVNDIISQYYIIYKNSHLACTMTSVQSSKELFSNIKKMGEYQEDEFIDLLFSQYYKGKNLKPGNIKLGNKQVYSMPILTTIGYNINEPTAVIIMFIDAGKIKSYMTSNGHTTKGNFLILDSKGTIIMSLNSECIAKGSSNLDEEKLKADYLIYQSPSSVMDWSYVLIQPKTEVFSDIMKQRNVATIILGIVLIIGLLTSLIAAKLNCRPFQKLQYSNEELAQRIKNQIPLLRQSFLERWLKGSYESIDELKISTKYLNANYMGGLYCVAVIQYAEPVNLMEEIKEPSSKEREIKQFIIKDILLQDLVDEEVIHDLDYNKIAIIYMSDGNDEDKFKEYVFDHTTACKKALENHQIVDVNYGIGSVCRLMTDVYKSLNNALDALQKKEHSEKFEISCYDIDNFNRDRYYYPSELELQLYHSTRSGNYKQVESILRDILNQNIIERTLPEYMLKLFTFELWGTLAKVQDNILNLDEDVNDYITTTFEKIDLLSNLERIQFCKKAFLDICKSSNSYKKNRQQSVMENINRYVQQNYSNPDFGLPMIADQFHLSNAYISQIFKEYNHETFIDFIQKIRIDEAKRLLDETNLSIKDIVEACGYNSSNTFGKAFKRIYGVSASDYREKK